MKKAPWILVGLLVGVLIATAIPVTAHHSDRAMKRRLNRLENQMAIQKQKTYYMDRDGYYNNIIAGSQVLSLCAPDSPATWVSDGNEYGIAWIEDCLGTMQASEVRAMKSFSVER